MAAEALREVCEGVRYSGFLVQTRGVALNLEPGGGEQKVSLQRNPKLLGPAAGWGSAKEMHQHPSS